MKKCKQCGEMKDAEAFYVTSYNTCKECHKKRCTASHRVNRDKYKEYLRRWKAKLDADPVRKAEFLKKKRVHSQNYYYDKVKMA